MGIKAALYVHLPFCRAKCPYCDFYSLPFSDLEKIPVKEFLEALKKEITLWQPRLKNHKFVTFYAGGGTPSLLPPSFFEELFSFLKANLYFIPEEATIEVNPEGLTFENLLGYRRVFNRISIGAQSFTKKGLKALGRRHLVSDIEKAVTLARKAGFSNLSLDMIYAWPGENLEDLEEELKLLVSFEPQHVSCYELTPEPETPLWELIQKNKIKLLPEEKIIKFFWFIHEFLEGKGFKHYEISNYARPGYQCKHNLFYWEAKPYLGLGPGAASFLEGKRFKNEENLKKYLEALGQGQFPPREIETLDAEARFREAVILGLRVLKGISLPEFKKHFGFDVLTYYGKTLKSLLAEGFLILENDRLRLSRKGILLSNFVFRELV
ncbi:radical SAM family heme chaperone HemW [Thermodesulfatator autotrophicus]|uniref:Heme chaperone HemW n=1 Tax=Thermodesulfatator autotrophicus TaxID=1795632 RepID=A0A177E7W6_9BACT|nr:radical SAM family heme chaperone HemW [Thermodesulfatator autotrophicus]OAG27796.1 hypothetical protein TH606_04980 [Thermodesulfatator autotrophicus]